MGSVPIQIPDRALFKASEVCQIAQIKPYILRSWEGEFEDLGVARTPGGPRVYRRADLDRVLTIKQLLFEEGLTIAGARRRLEGEGPAASGVPAIEEVFGEDVRARLSAVKNGLRELVDLLAESPAGGSPSIPFHRAAAPAAEAKDDGTEAATGKSGRGRATVRKMAARRRAPRERLRA